MKKVKAVLFDFDGTIFDTNKLILESWHEVFRVKGGAKSDDEILATFGEPLVISMEKWFPGQSEECIKIYRGYQKDIFFEKIEIYEGMGELIKKLKALGFLNAIVTSRLVSSTTETLEKYDLMRYFDAVVTCEDTGKHKPDPEPALLALEKLGVAADEAVMIGDSKFDIKCAHNAGIKGVLVGWSEAKGDIPETGDDAPDFIIEKAEDLLEILA